MKECNVRELESTNRSMVRVFVCVCMCVCE